MNSNRLLIILLFFGCLFSAPFANDEKQSHLNSSQIPVVLKLNGGGSNESSELGPKMASKQDQVRTSNKREMLKKHFPDWEERINYQKKQEKNYRSALNRIAEANRLRVKLKLPAQEQDALDYFNGENFYSYHQSLETPPNIYDTRSSFLLKVEKNREMRENFLKAYNRREGAN